MLMKEWFIPMELGIDKGFINCEVKQKEHYTTQLCNAQPAEAQVYQAFR